MKLSNRNYPLFIIESLVMTLGVFLIYLLPGNSALEISSTDSIKSGLQIESSAYKLNVPEVVQFNNIVCSNHVTTSKDYSYYKTDFYKLSIDNNRIYHFYNVNSLVELKIKPFLHKGFYYYYHPSALEEASILS